MEPSTIGNGFAAPRSPARHRSETSSQLPKPRTGAKKSCCCPAVYLTVTHSPPQSSVMPPGCTAGGVQRAQRVGLGLLVAVSETHDCAAALAAAQSCVWETGDEEAQADTFAALNATGTSGGITDDCGGEWVTVRYTAQQQLFFAPVLGFGSSDDVSAEATAGWGGAGAANPLPIVLNLATFQGDCDIPDVAKGTICHLWYDNDRFDGSNFGFMNLEQWNVGAGDHCSSSGSSNETIGSTTTGPESPSRSTTRRQRTYAPTRASPRPTGAPWAIASATS